MVYNILTLKNICICITVKLLFIKGSTWKAASFTNQYKSKLLAILILALMSGHDDLCGSLPIQNECDTVKSGWKTDPQKTEEQQKNLVETKTTFYTFYNSRPEVQLRMNLKNEYLFFEGQAYLCWEIWLYWDKGHEVKIDSFASPLWCPATQINTVHMKRKGIYPWIFFI